MIRAAQRLMLAMRGHLEIRDIPTKTFNLIVSSLKQDGWTTRHEYHDSDAWTEYARLDLVWSSATIRCEWTNEAAGRISGPARLLKEIAVRFGLCEPGGANGRWL